MIEDPASTKEQKLEYEDVKTKVVLSSIYAQCRDMADDKYVLMA
jgi:hypothetical protein